MTENEAKQWLKHTRAYQHKCDNCEYIDIKGACNEECKDFYDIAIQALSEIQQYRAIGTVEEFQKSIKEEDVLKFYHIESEDKYVVGQRRDTRYYGEVGKTGLAFYMSRYLPWGEHVVAPETLWKEHTYPSEPKEIPFFDWLQGFIKKECGGTIEECRTAVERMKPYKPKEYEDRYYACKCGNPLLHKWDEYPTKLMKKSRGYAYCLNCGQAIDWSE